MRRPSGRWSSSPGLRPPAPGEGIRERAMRYRAEFRDAPKAARLAAAIHRLAKRPVAFMEVCGTHTVAIFRHGLRQLLPDAVQLISGPGCPVCVTPTAEIDRAIAIAALPEVTLATFGAMLRG